MKLFKCQQCGQLLYFENTYCERCGRRLGFFPGNMELLTLSTEDNHTFTNILQKEERYRYCQNAQHAACNWLVNAYDHSSFCLACMLNKTVPDLSNPDHIVGWRKLENAKHRLVYTLLQLGLPLSAKNTAPDHGLAFDFLAEHDLQKRVIMGHAEGLITINLAEADEVKRVSAREELGEPYRTLVGHFRHEAGHYYWDRIIKDDGQRQLAFRKIFGDERNDYGQALQRYYVKGAPVGWQKDFVSAYATAHPWEDWAETWAHYFHIMDTLETAYSFGLRINPVAASKVEMLAAEYTENPFVVRNFQQLIDLWFPLTAAINSVNRSMGQPDFYPFVVSPTVIEKLNFVHTVILEVRRATFTQMHEAQSSTLASD